MHTRSVKLLRNAAKRLKPVYYRFNSLGLAALVFLWSSVWLMGAGSPLDEAKGSNGPSCRPITQWRFVAYGDQSTSCEASRLVDQMRDQWHQPGRCRPIRLVVHAGDAAYLDDPGSTAEQWWNNTVARLRNIPLGNNGLNYVLALGNHDQETPELRNWYRTNVINPLLLQEDWSRWSCEQGSQTGQCERLIFSYSYRNAHFIVADLDGGGDPSGKRDARLGSRALSWIGDDITRAKTAQGGCFDDNNNRAPCDWIFYTSHPSCYSLIGPLGDAANLHGDDVFTCNSLESILARGVDVVIQGHTHQYYRTFPMLPTASTLRDHRNPQPKCGTNCPEENYSSDDLAGAPIYMTVGTGGNEIYSGDSSYWSSTDPESPNFRGRLNAYAAAFPEAGNQRRNFGTYADKRLIRAVPVTHGAAVFTIDGRCLQMEYADLAGRCYNCGQCYDRFTINKSVGECRF